jgi:hypothetical protein
LEVIDGPSLMFLVFFFTKLAVEVLGLFELSVGGYLLKGYFRDDLH